MFEPNYSARIERNSRFAEKVCTIKNLPGGPREFTLRGADVPRPKVLVALAEKRRAEHGTEKRDAASIREALRAELQARQRRLEQSAPAREFDRLDESDSVTFRM